ncbi:hypothetical protein H181DRAFT_03425 [Streptomyces sp. WMMB 714]|uniref:hypothetical protein n=1 Tax=Streptomyces sp. WMMB 714 TaxID=1286822 RepID=UPI0008238780|nr:hypothetical protein [Streptomyces sp. WMMB 714]SCK39820.1 hypothetical protein H181DRAFT_03425 [Streptomyces sp. WMMB 714]
MVMRALLAGIVGGVIGIAAYSISQTGGQPLSVAVGCLIGVAVVLGGELYRRSAQLTEVRLVVLGSEMSFKTKTDMRHAAQRMFFQAATRVATRPLEDGHGNLREALTSLKTLFDLYREPLESEGTPLPPANGNSVYELALHILNFELAPFLTKWHPRLKAFEESDRGQDESEWSENSVFREELRALQERLRPYLIGLGEIAGIPDPASHLRRSARVSPPASATVPDQPSSPATPE